MKPVPRHTPLRVESLEDREVPAGLLNTTFANGTLKIVGDSDANTVTISQTADGRLTLTTDIGTALKVNGSAVTGFLGHTLPTPVTGGVTVNLGGGFDSLTISGQVEDVDMPSFLSINGGDGNNLVTLQQGVTVSGDLTIVNGAGSDTTHLNDDVTVLGKVSIRNGNGGSLIDSNATGKLHVGKTFSVISGVGYDAIEFTPAQTISLGGFLQRTGIDTDGSSTDLSPVQSLIITGAVSVVNGAGDDDFDLGDPTLETTIAGAISISNGAGSNHTDLSGTDRLSVGGSTVISGGIGNDLVHLGINSGLVSFGSITANVGSGTNGFLLAGTELHIHGNVTVNGGTGSDQFQIIANNGGTLTGGIKIAMSGGQNSFDLRGGTGGIFSVTGSFTLGSANPLGLNTMVSLRDLKVQGATSVLTGSGNDFIDVDDVTFNGTFVLTTGMGNDNVNFEQLMSSTGHTTFNQSATILFGAGDDTLKSAGVVAEAERKTIFHSSVKFDGGLGALGVDTIQLAEFGANLFYGTPAVKVGF